MSPGAGNNAYSIQNDLKMIFIFLICCFLNIL